MRHRFVLAGALLAALAAAGAADAADGAADGNVFPFPVHAKTLANGLQVVAVPYDSPGIVAYVTVVRTGSRDEVEPGHSGFAHFFEHMMFRGTKKHSAEAYNDALKRMGADSNAFTSDDTTVYHIVGPAAELATLFDLEADRFQNLEYGEEAFRTEAGAILGEYSKNASSPFLPMLEKLRDLAFDAHTYEHTTMGFLADIQRMPEEYAYSLSFFRRFYRPDNVTLVVVGDVQPERVLALAEQHYGPWKRGYQPPAVRPEGPPHGPRRAHLDWATPTNPYLMMGWRSPAFAADRDAAARLVIEQLLFSESAPLYQQLVVDEQWVDFVTGGSNPHRDPYLFTLTSRVRSRELLPRVEQAIGQHLARLREQAADPRRLDRVKSHLRYGFSLDLDTPRSVAMELAQMVWLTGEVGSLNRIWAEIEQVTPADVQRAARELFVDRNLSVVTLAHQPPAAVAQPGGGR